MQVLMAIFLGLRFLHLDSRVHAAASGDKRVEAFPPSHQTRGNGPIRQIVGGVSMNDIRKGL